MPLAWATSAKYGRPSGRTGCGTGLRGGMWHPAGDEEAVGSAAMTPAHKHTVETRTSPSHGLRATALAHTRGADIVTSAHESREHAHARAALCAQQLSTAGGKRAVVSAW